MQDDSYSDRSQSDKLVAERAHDKGKKDPGVEDDISNDSELEVISVVSSSSCDHDDDSEACDDPDCKHCNQRRANEAEVIDLVDDDEDDDDKQQDAKAKVTNKNNSHVSSPLDESEGTDRSSETPRRPILKASPQPQPPRSFFTWLVLLRSLLFDIPLMLLFASFLLTWFMKHMYTGYYQPLMVRARRTDDQLLEEFTYYERQCTEYDLTTTNLRDLLVKDNDTIPAAIDKMLLHGATVVPDVLKAETVTNLRDYLQWKNAAIPEDAQYPVSQQESRISYGIEGSEHEAVSQALREIATHSVMQPLMSQLLGDADPASAEITAITSFVGSEDQVWHQDTKQDGNAIKFARTFSHSYSLFLPLQDTTERMGATDICPGTHMCANDLEVVCDRNKLGLHLVGMDNSFPAGSGALLNQHVWHRGGAHTDPDAPERIVFIVSFLARPNVEADPRQLSRGTYFHQKWNMWGHTWSDLKASMSYMSYPFSVLRCLSIWKPPSSYWGYDLITSILMRFSNGQLEEDDFENRFLPRLDQLGFPQFLRGRQLLQARQHVMWRVFFDETLDITYEFAYKVNVIGHAAYVLLVVVLCLLLASARGQSTGKIRAFAALQRLLITHGLLLILGLKVWYNVTTSPWAKAVVSGHALMRPFPPVDAVSEAEALTVSRGPTTFPVRSDVLFGTRYDAAFLGSYDRWLDFHPGNVLFRNVVANAAQTYAAYARTSPVLRLAVVQSVAGAMHDTQGRLLQQDFRTGDWRILEETESFEAIAGELALGSDETLSFAVKNIDWIVAMKRFGPQRGTPMARFSQLQLWYLRKSLLLEGEPIVLPKEITLAVSPTQELRTMSGRLTLPHSPIDTSAANLSKRTFFSDVTPPSSKLRTGSLIWAYFDDSEEWFPGTILGESAPDWYNGAFDDNSIEAVHITNIRPYRPVTEGDTVKGCYERDLQDCYTGVVTTVHPGGSISIRYPDGEVEDLVPPHRWYSPPYNYMGPFPTA